MFHEIVEYIKHPNQIWNSGRKRILVENFFSLSVLQLLNYLLPMITFPYLVAVLGIDNFGAVSFAQAFVQIFVIITDFGFNVSATRDISVAGEKKVDLSKVFYNVMYTKVTLLILGLLLYLLLIFNFSRFTSDNLLYLFSFGIVIGNTLFPTWFFSGIEKMKWITILNFISKLVYTILIVTIVKLPENYVLVPVFSSIGLFVAVIISYIIIIKKYVYISFRFLSFNEIYTEIKKGFHVFLAGIFGNIYGQGTIIILGLLTNNLIVGYYSVSEKIFKIFASIGSVISQTIFPYVSKSINKCIEKKYFNKILLLSIMSAFVLSVGIFVFSKKIYTIVANEIYWDGIWVLRFLIMLLPMEYANNIINSFLLAMRCDKIVSKMYVIVGIIFVFVCVFCILTFGIYGPVLGLLFVELCLLIWGLKNYIKFSKQI